MAFSMEGRFPLSSKKFMQYCLDIKSEFKFGLDKKETKHIIKEAYKDRLPNYILNKSKTGWSAPIMDWLDNDTSLRNKYNENIKKDDGIKNALLSDNFFDNAEIGKSLSGKRKIVSWMLRSWAQEFDMYL